MATVPAELPTAAPTNSIKERFEKLAVTWHEAVAHHSSSRIRDNHPAYLEIISLGPAVIPLLLRDMEANHTHWFCALRKISGATPITTAEAGNIPKMVQAWLRWAKDQGYQW